MQKILVWDVPIRLFHWLLVLAVAGLVVTAKVGGNWLEWHTKLGYFVLGLVFFRLIWGFVGTTHARFGAFLRGPKAVVAYTRTLFAKHADATSHVGHNPLGGWSTMVMLVLIGFQAISGLFANDDVLLEGPYANRVTKATSDFLTKLHKLNSDLILILIGIHVVAIALYYFYKKDNLVKPMLTGKKEVGDDVRVPPQTPRPYWVFALCVIFVSLFTYSIATRIFG